MSKFQDVLSLIGKSVEPTVAKTSDTLTIIMAVHKHLDNMMKNYDVLQEAFEKVGLDKSWGECGNCGMHTLVEMGNCPVCGNDLIGTQVEAEQQEEYEEVVEEKSKKKKKAAAKKKPEPVEEEVEVEEEEAEEVEAEEEAEVELEEDAGEEEEEEDFPSVDEINAMKKADLLAVIEEHELEVDEKLIKGRALKKLRDAVNDAIEELLAEEEYEEEDEGEEPEVYDESDDVDAEEGEEDDDLDLDNLNLDDLDDLDEMGEDEDEEGIE